MNHQLSQHNDHEPDDNRSLRSGRRFTCLVISLTAMFTLCMSGCSLSADRATMERQAKAPWWPGSSIADEVYPSSVQKEVYAK